MHIITTRNYVAGIFASDADAKQYVSLIPSRVGEFTHVEVDLEYPFWLLEIGDDSFASFQTKSEARGQGIGVIIYTIYKDYWPYPSWSDSMGCLEHDHVKDMDNEEF